MDESNTLTRGNGSHGSHLFDSHIWRMIGYDKMAYEFFQIKFLF